LIDGVGNKTSRISLFGGRCRTGISILAGCHISTPELRTRLDAPGKTPESEIDTGVTPLIGDWRFVHRGPLQFIGAVACRFARKSRLR
jgi:hypothetical protein